MCRQEGRTGFIDDGWLALCSPHSLRFLIPCMILAAVIQRVKCRDPAAVHPARVCTCLPLRIRGLPHTLPLPCPPPSLRAPQSFNVSSAKTPAVLQWCIQLASALAYLHTACHTNSHPPCPLPSPVCHSHSTFQVQRSCSGAFSSPQLSPTSTAWTLPSSTGMSSLTTYY